MSDGSADKHVGIVRTLFDVVLILVLGLVAEAAHFSWLEGRPIVNGDCAQYVDAAETLLDADESPNLAVVKPGYPLILAGVALATGNMSWAGVAANHLFQAFLPLAAYGLGRNLRSRFVGWVAAILAIAQLQAHIGGGLLTSDAAYMCFLSFGALALARGLTGRRSMGLVATAGLLLAAAWLIRSGAVVVIAAALLCIIWVRRDRLRRAVWACLCLALPVMAVALLECSLNQVWSGRFRPSTGSFGPMLMMRTRHLQGLSMPDTEAGRRCLALLPERDPEDAYRAVEVDTWAARYRAVHDHGMNDWQVDAIMRQAAWEMITAHKVEFLACSLDVFVRHVLRQRDGPSYARVPPEQRLPVVVHPAGQDDPDPWGNWYAYLGLPHRTLEESSGLASRMKAAASQRAPFAEVEPWPTLRNWSMSGPAVDVMGVLRGVASVWPGFALILCGALGLNRRTCAFFAIAYVLEGILIAICTPSEFTRDRYQSVWLATDTALTAAFVTAVISVAAVRIKAAKTARQSAENATLREAEAERVRRRLIVR